MIEVPPTRTLPMPAYRPPLEVTPSGAPAASIIWLHGLGADGDDFLPIIDELNLARLPPLRFVFPHAPLQPVSLNHGTLMPSWYDIYSLGDTVLEEAAGIRVSMQFIAGLIEGEMQRGIPARHILLAGFSQGGNVALNCALRYPQRLAGTMVLSSYLGLAECLEPERTSANADMPVFMAHGTQDPILPIALGRHAMHTLTRLHYPVSWHEYPMQHTVCAQEVADLQCWMEQSLPH